MTFLFTAALTRWEHEVLLHVICAISPWCIDIRTTNHLHGHPSRLEVASYRRMILQGITVLCLHNYGLQPVEHDTPT